MSKPGARTLRLDDLERSGRGAKTRYVARVADAKGAERYELVIAGPRAAIERAFEETAFAVEIDPDAGEREAEELLRPAFEEEQRARQAFAAVEDVPGLFKKKPPSAPTAERSVFLSLRRLEPGGTTYFVVTGPFFVPRFANVFFVLPPVCTTFGILTPLSGDQDLFLNFAWPPFSPAFSSIRGGTTPDVITHAVFCTFFSHFVPIYRVFGFTSGVCSRFTFGGADIFR